MTDSHEMADKTKPQMLLGLTIVFTYALLILGNLVTTTGSGLECPDWPLCHGSVNPPHMIGVWIEWSHRLLGGVTGVLLIASAIYMFKRTSGAVKFFMKLVLGLIAAVVVLGGIIVIIEAPLLDTFLRIAVVSSHIVLATMIFVAMIMAFRATRGGTEVIDEKNYTLWLFGIVYFQVIVGIVVRYGNASLACPDWPLCHGSVLPPFFEGEVLLHYFHRFVAYTIFGLSLWRVVKAFKSGEQDRNLHLVTFLIVLLQAVFGILIVLTQLLLPFVILHGAAGFLLLGWSAYLVAPFVAMREQSKAGV